MYRIYCKDVELFEGKVFTSMQLAKLYLLKYLLEYENDSEREIIENNSDTYKVKVTRSFKNGHGTIYFSIKVLEVDPIYI